MASYVRGDKLPAPLQHQVLSMFVHRWTTENQQRTYHGECPACVQRRHTETGELQDTVITDDGRRIAWHDWHLPMMADREWLALHSFAVTKRGTLDSRANHAMPAFMDGERA